MKQILALSVAVFLGTLAFLQLFNPAPAPVADAAAAPKAENAPPQQAAAATTVAPPPSGRKVSIQRSPDSHFRTQVQINGAYIDMLVDSGATSVVLTRADAERAGIMVGGSSDFTAEAQTANGAVRLKPVRLERVEIGGIERRDVQAAILDQQDGTSLLGQSFLSKIDHVSIKGDTMTLE